MAPAHANTGGLAHIYFFIDNKPFFTDNKPAVCDPTSAAPTSIPSAVISSTPVSGEPASSKSISDKPHSSKPASSAQDEKASKPLKNDAKPQEDTRVNSATLSSRTSSPGSSHSTNISASASSSSKSSASSLRAAAPSFIPFGVINPSPALAPTLSTSISHLFETRDIPNKGVGLVATGHIPCSTPVIYEPPLLRITRNELYLVWEQYQRLGKADKIAYDSLHSYHHENLGLEQASRMHLLDPNDDDMDSDDEEEAMQEHVRVMNIFATNNFIIANGCHAVFKVTSRLNHSCRPNVYACYNPVLKMETVHAIRDIAKGEELVTNYVGERVHYWNRQQRWEVLHHEYGFTCECGVCQDFTGIADARRAVLGSTIWGLEEYKKGKVSNGNQYIPSNGQDALLQAEDIIRIMLEEGMFGIELTKAYRRASTLALDIENFDKAIEYARDEHEIERNIMGTELGDLMKNGAASEMWFRHLEKAIRKKNQQLEVEFNRNRKANNKKCGAKTGEKSNEKPGEKTGMKTGDEKKSQKMTFKQKREAAKAAKAAQQ